MDRIELSNLSRQFLFRRKHVGKAKSLSAKEAGTEMNPAVEAATRVHEVRVGPDTEDVFTDQYWKKLDIVLNGTPRCRRRCVGCAAHSCDVVCVDSGGAAAVA